VANLLAFQPDEQIAQVLDVRDYATAPYLVLATRDGMVKKTRLEAFDSNRSGGIIAINLREGDELISAQLVEDGADLLLVSAKGMSARFTADDETLRPMGRDTSGVIGMKFRGDDHLLAMNTVREGAYLVTITDGGYAKRTPVDDWSVKGRGILGVRAMKLVEERGSLVGALVALEDDELYAIASDGVVIRTRVADIRSTGRDTMGVSLMDVSGDNAIVAVALGDAGDDDEADDVDAPDVENPGSPDDASTPQGGADEAAPDESVTVAVEDAAYEPQDGPAEQD
jgi:DNA gyrase subunit A